MSDKVMDKEKKKVMLSKFNLAQAYKVITEMSKWANQVGMKNVAPKLE